MTFVSVIKRRCLSCEGIWVYGVFVLFLEKLCGVRRSEWVYEKGVYRLVSDSLNETCSLCNTMADGWVCINMGSVTTCPEGRTSFGSGGTPFVRVKRDTEVEVSHECIDDWILPMIFMTICDWVRCFVLSKEIRLLMMYSFKFRTYKS